MKPSEAKLREGDRRSLHHTSPSNTSHTSTSSAGSPLGPPPTHQPKPRTSKVAHGVGPCGGRAVERDSGPAHSFVRGPAPRVLPAGGPGRRARLASGAGGPASPGGEGARPPRLRPAAPPRGDRAQGRTDARGSLASGLLRWAEDGWLDSGRRVGDVLQLLGGVLWRLRRTLTGDAGLLFRAGHRAGLLGELAGGGRWRGGGGPRFRNRRGSHETE